MYFHLSGTSSWRHCRDARITSPRPTIPPPASPRWQQLSSGRSSTMANCIMFFCRNSSPKFVLDVLIHLRKDSECFAGVLFGFYSLSYSVYLSIYLSFHTYLSNSLFYTCTVHTAADTIMWSSNQLPSEHRYIVELICDENSNSTSTSHWSISRLRFFFSCLAYNTY